MIMAKDVKKYNTKNSKTTKKSSNTIRKSSNKKVTTKTPEKHIQKNTFIMKLLILFGVIIFFFVLIYLMYHFFVKKSDILINMSTDKQMEYIEINGNEELIMTQKYVSDLNYSMRYDINEFKVFKYKKQDIFKNLNDERVVVVVEKSNIPSTCKSNILETDYNNCYVEVDNYTEEYYVSSQNNTYKITIKSPGKVEYDEPEIAQVSYMLKSFQIK